MFLIEVIYYLCFAIYTKHNNFAFLDNLEKNLKKAAQTAFIPTFLNKYLL